MRPMKTESMKAHIKLPKAKLRIRRDSKHAVRKFPKMKKSMRSVKYAWVKKVR